MDPVDLDERLDRELRELPLPRAPRTLLPRVLAASAQQGASAKPTGWSTWTVEWRIASVAVVAVLATVVSMLFAAPPQRVSQATETAGEVATVVRVLWEVMLQPIATYLFILGVSLALACALAWAALDAALGGASHR
jgi:hypothetical protein